METIEQLIRNIGNIELVLARDQDTLGPCVPVARGSGRLARSIRCSSAPLPTSARPRWLNDAETRERQEPISTPAFHVLADEVTEKGRTLFDLANIQDRLGDAADTGNSTIDDVNQSKGDADS